MTQHDFPLLPRLKCRCVCKEWRRLFDGDSNIWREVGIDGWELSSDIVPRSVLWRFVFSLRGTTSLSIHHLRGALRDKNIISEGWEFWPNLSHLSIFSSIGIVSDTNDELRSLFFSASILKSVILTLQCISTIEMEQLFHNNPKLEYVDLRANVHTNLGDRGPAFPTEVTNLRELKFLRLELQKTNFDRPVEWALPDDLSGWTDTLEELHIVRVGLRALPPSIGNLKKLHTLNLGYNKLGENAEGSLPVVAFQQITNLTKLSLECNNFEAAAPAAVGALGSNLKHLELGSNFKNTQRLDWPAVYASLRGLKYLGLYNCGLHTLPSILVDCFDNLEVLVLTFNCLTDIPGGKYLRNLRKIDLMLNRDLVEYPEVLKDIPGLFCRLGYSNQHIQNAF